MIKETKWSNKFYHRDENRRRILISPTMFKDKVYYFTMVKDEDKETIEYVNELSDNKIQTFVMSRANEKMQEWLLSIYNHSKKTLMGSIALAKLMREKADEEIKKGGK